MEAQKPNIPQQKPQPVKAATTQPRSAAAGDKAVKSNVKGIKNAAWVIIIDLVICVCLFLFGLGYSGNFNVEGAPTFHFQFPDTLANSPKNLLGTMYMGGFVVPILLTCLLTVIVISVERWFALSKASGTGNITAFVENVKKALAARDINKAKDLCRKQQGTVGAVVYATLITYEEMDKDTKLLKEQKLTSIQQTLEEATALEMPSLQQNLPIAATMTTLGTLLGLFGTVLGMIKSFQALSQSGAPDSTQLSTGISEALVNTACGILTAALALICYNYYSNKIDTLTYAIDELGFSIVSTFSATH